MLDFIDQILSMAYQRQERKGGRILEFGSFLEFHRRGDHTQAEAFQEWFAHVDQAEEQGLDAAWLAE